MKLKTNRRGFLGLLGGAAAAGPSAVKSASAMTMTDLSLEGVASAASQVQEVSGLGNAGWAKRSLVKWANPDWKERRKREWHVRELDPNTAALRSVALSSKIRITKQMQFLEHERSQKSYLERMLSGEEDGY